MAKKVVNVEELGAEVGADNVKKFTLSNEDGSKVLDDVLIVVPDKEAYCNYLTWVDKSMLRANTALIRACVKSHVDEINADDELFLAAASAAASLIKVGTFKLKK
ncbi:MAG: hypothetical protein K2Q03_05740 [Sphingobacteriaceae bacterium]|nr:hypothetical protein [Sphingobacteriaceae bacterium]